MTCKICMQEYNESNRRPQIILPCCHTFCSCCLDYTSADLACKDCGTPLQERKTNTAILDALNQKKAATVKENIKRFERNLRWLYLEYKSKRQENSDKLDELDDQITNKVNQLVEIIFQNHFKLREQIEQSRIQLDEQLSQILKENEIELLRNKLNLIKSNQDSSQCFNHLSQDLTDLNGLMNNIFPKMKSLGQFEFDVNFKQNDLIIQNSLDIVGQLIHAESAVVETLPPDMSADTSSTKTTTNVDVTGEKSLKIKSKVIYNTI